MHAEKKHQGSLRSQSFFFHSESGTRALWFVASYVTSVVWNLGKVGVET